MRGVSDDEAEIEVYYAPSEDGDSEWIPYAGRIEGISDEADGQEGDPHLCGSGYRAVAVTWDTGDPDFASPWEIIIRHAPAEPDRAKLSEEEKKHVREALKLVKEMEGVRDYFIWPVDQTLYSDYGSMIELSMDLSFISKRLEADYYSTVFSVVADVKLIRDNCIKYNGEHDEISQLAGELLGKFEELVLGNELSDYRKLQEELTANAQPRSTDETTPTVVTSPETNTTGSSVRRSSRRQVQARSSLEDLPRPSPARPQRRTRRGRTRTSSQNARQGTRRSVRSVLESAPQVVPRTLEDLSSTNGTSSRGRRTTNRSGGRVLRSSHEVLDEVTVNGHSARERRTRAGTRVMDPLSGQSAAAGQLSTSRTRSRQTGLGAPVRTARSTRGNVSYADQPSDVDDQAELGNVRRSSRFHQSREPELSGVESSSLLRLESTSRSARVTRRSSHNLAALEAPSIPSNGSQQQQRQTRTRNAARQQPSPEPSSSDEEESPASQRRLRQQRQTRTRSAATQQPSPEPSSSEEEESPMSERRSRRMSTIRKSRRQMSSDENSQSESEEESDPSEDHFEANASEDESSMSVASEEESPPTRRSTRARAAATSGSPGSFDLTEDGRGGRKRSHADMESPRTRRGVRLSYEDPSSSEFGSDVEETPDTKPRASRQGARRSSTNSERKNTSRPPSKKKREQSSGVDFTAWPDVPMKKITIIAKAVLNRFVSTKLFLASLPGRYVPHASLPVPTARS